MLFIYIVAGLCVLILLAWGALELMANIVFKKVVARPRDKGVIKDAKSLSNRPAAYEEFVKDSMTRLKERYFEGVSINTFDGLRLQGYYFPSEKPTKRLVICVHGYTSYAFRGFSHFVPFYHDAGLNVLLYDNRAHGESEGEYCGLGVLDRKDLQCWIDYAVGRVGADAEIYLHGTSMGGATVLMESGLELQPQVKGIIADCPFSNFYEQMNHTIKAASGINGSLIVKLVSRVCKRKAGFGFRDVDAAEEIKKATVPVLFFHGTRDDFVTPENTEKIYANCPTKKEKVIIEGAGHGMCYYMAPREVESKITDFIFGQSDVLAD